MCGIAGYYSKNSVPDYVLDSMVSALVHRGPDSAGFYQDGPYHAGMRRLSINDVEGGDQPLFNRDKSVALLYNGEIYNAPELRSELERKGIQFQTSSDGEVICHLYDEMDERLFELLDGMFAVALWDSHRKRLILARDIPGEKPLYYTCRGNGDIVFASELTSLARFPNLNISLNHQALWDFPTFLWIPEPATVYENIYALPPGHILTCDAEGISIKPYSKDNFETVPFPEDEDVIAETGRLVIESVRRRLLSDVPVGSFLSSGLDSSIIATLAAKFLPDLTTYTIGFEDVNDPYHGRADESPDVEAYAKKIGTNHRTIQVNADDFRRELDVFTRYGDQPFAVSSGLGILAIARAAREDGIKVLLSGDGADETFGGYSWYQHFGEIKHNREQLPSWMNSQVSMQYVNVPLEQVLTALHGYDSPKRAWAWHYYASEEDKYSLFSPDAFEGKISSHEHFYSYKNGTAWLPEDYIRQDRLFYFPNEMLRKVDRMTMAYSVEGRVPFAAPSILAFADTLKYSQMVRGGTLKWVLRQAFRDILPPEILNRPKHGFNVPIDHWLKGRWSDMVKETFAPSSALSRMKLIQPDAENTAWKMLNDSRRLTGHTIFCFVQLNKWLEQKESVTV